MHNNLIVISDRVKRHSSGYSRVAWPPPRSLQTLLSAEQETLYFDIDELTRLEYRRSARRAAHCVIYAKLRSRQRALMMARKIY